MLMKSILFMRLHRARLIGAIIILFAYAPGVFQESFWSDDYPALMDTPDLVDHLMRDARPTAAALLSTSFSLINDPTSAWILRGLALVTLLIIFLFITNLINISKFREIGTLSIAISFCLPSFQMYIHWSTTWFYLLAALAGLYAFHLWSTKILYQRVLAVFFLALALTTYPPAALFFFAVIAVANIINESKNYKFFAETVQGVILLFMSGLMSIIIVFITMQIFNLSPNRRVKLVTLADIPDKISWLVSRPFVIGLRPFMIDSPSAKIALITSIPVLLILVLGMRRQARHLGESFFYRVLCVVLLFLASLAPIVVTSDNQIEFRILPGYSWGVLTIASYYFLILIHAWIESLKMNRKLAIASKLIVPMILSIVGITTINAHYTDFFRDPYLEKNIFLNAKISSCSASTSFKRVLIIPPEIPFPSLPRLGVFSMSTDLASGWVPKPNVELLLRRVSINVPVIYIETRPTNMSVNMTDCVIDLEEFRRSLTLGSLK